MDKKKQIYADLTDNEKAEAKRIARERGMTFSGFIGQLIKKEIENERK